MPVRENIINNDGTYFTTFTCTNWLPLFEKANAYSSVYKWFDEKTNNYKFILDTTVILFDSPEYI